MPTKFTIWIWNFPFVCLAVSSHFRSTELLVGHITNVQQSQNLFFSLIAFVENCAQKSWPQTYFPPGIIPRSIVHIFEGKTAEEDEDTMYDVRVSYIEIYNEEIRLSYFTYFPLYVLFLRFI